ncbi:glycoside hydrolase family 15 protein [Jatrophihabitans fulvus]
MARDADGYADLRDYAAVGDGRTMALVATDGRVDWLPLPRLDSPPAFAALLDAEHGGHLTLQPDGPFESTRQYLPGTNVLVTEFTTAAGRVRVTDSLNSGLAGPLPWSEFARRIEGVEGSVTMRALVRPGTCLNTAAPYVEATDFSACLLRSNSLAMTVQCDGEDAVDWTARDVTVTFTTSAGSRQLFALVATEGEPLFVPDAAAIDAGVDRTIANWQHWSTTFAWDGRWPEQVQRSATLLKQLIRVSDGSMAAAATLGLPESTSGGKNWDYRFAWTRDTAYSLTALLRFGLREEVHAAISWLLRALRASGSVPHVMYRLDGAQPDGTHERDVPGWRNIGPVVEGNRAADQLQLGVYGDVFSIVRLYVDDRNVLDAATGRALAALADVVCDRWRSKDSGMWELPEARHYTTSKLGCWQALQHAVHLAELGQVQGNPERWRHEADAIRAWVDDHCWDGELGAYVWYPGTRELDASILLHAISGFDRGERMVSTIRVLREELGAGTSMYRFSGAREQEGAFVACAYWTVSALYLCGHEDEAVALMDELVDALPNDVGVLAEMTAPDGSFLGNLPQALSHLALLNAAITASGL